MKTFIDIGANEGAVSLIASRLVGPAGRIIFFEPNPVPRSVFQTAISRNAIQNISIEAVGVGNANTTLTPTSPKMNSREGTCGKSNYKASGLETVDCEVRCGEDILVEFNPAFIKIDIEGFVLRVLQGLQETIAKNHPPIAMEMIAGHLANCRTKVSTLVEFMSERG